MLRHRKVMLAVTIGVAGGSFYAALGYAVYLHSDHYRLMKQRELASFLELPASIGRVDPRRYYQADFLDIRVWLPGRRAEVFRCDRAEMHELPGQGGAFDLVIRDGRLTIDAQQWHDSDYRTVLRSGLAHDFESLKLRKVDLLDVDLTWRQDPIAFTVRRATGRIQFDGYEEGRISVISRTLNDTETVEPIHVAARFRPARELVVHEVVFRVPSLPVKALRLEPLLGVSDPHGRFEGKLSYNDKNGGPHLRLEGRAQDIHLDDWTGTLSTGPLHGQVDVTIDHADLTDQGLAKARFSGRARWLRLDELARFAGIAPIQGTASLEVLNAEITDGTLVRMSLRGEVVDGSLEPIVAMIGPGKLTGTLRLKINALDLAGGEVVSGDVDVEVVPPKGQPATLDTQLIIEAARKLLGVELPLLIAAPLKRLDSVTYSRFAFKLLADNGQLRVLGTHGQGGRAILTVKIFGTDLTVVTQPERAFELAPLVARLRATGQRTFRELMERYGVPPATQPQQPSPP